MNDIIKTTAAGLQNISSKDQLEQLEKYIVDHLPELHELTPEQVNFITQKLTVDLLTAKMKKDIETLAADYTGNKDSFISHCKSENTKKAYRHAFEAFEAYMTGRGINNPLQCTPELADGFIYDMQAAGKSAATIRRNVAAISSFFSQINRYHNSIRNPFIGTKALPKKENAKRIENELPTENLKLFAKDVKTIINAEQNKELKAIIVCMAARGLRAGSFENMTIRGNHFYTTSKGKDIAGELPAVCIQAIKAANVKHNTPFAGWQSAKVSSAFQYHIAKLYAAGKISYKYSAHDLRHYYALTEYTKTKDIYNVSKLLGHASIAITEVYLRGLKVNI